MIPKNLPWPHGFPAAGHYCQAAILTYCSDSVFVHCLGGPIKRFRTAPTESAFHCAGTPGPIVARLKAGAVTVRQMPEVRNPITSQGNGLAADSPEAFLAYIRIAMEKWGKVIQTAGVKNE